MEEDERHGGGRCCDTEVFRQGDDAKCVLFVVLGRRDCAFLTLVVYCLDSVVKLLLVFVLLFLGLREASS